jgi:hypothetical protein
MSAKPENTFISSVHKHLPVELYHMKNNNPYNSGIADVWYSGVEQDLWVEYKFLVIPKRGDTVIDLVGGKNPSISALQQTWLKDRDVEGRNVGVIVRRAAYGSLTHHGTSHIPPASSESGLFHAKNWPGISTASSVAR